jgi:integrase
MARPKTGSVFLRGKRWYVRYTIRGKRYQKATNARNKTEAQAILNKYMPKEYDYAERGKVDFTEYAEKWLERRKVNLKPSVYDRYKLILEKHICPCFTNTKLSEIYAGEVQDFVLHLSRKVGRPGKHLSPKTVNNILLVLNRIMGDAADDRRIEQNPVIFKKHRLPYHPKEKDHFTLEDMNLFLDCVYEEFLPFFITAWHTGLRLGELIGLKWEDVDWQRGALMVRRSVYQTGRQNVVTSPKSKAGIREIFLTPYLLNTLKSYEEQKKVQGIDQYIFEKDGKPYNKDGIVRSQFRHALRAAGLRKTLTPHSIRHGLISLMRSKFPEYVVKRMIGHSLGNGITEVYTHVTDEEMRKYSEQLGQILGTNIKKRIERATVRS